MARLGVSGFSFGTTVFLMIGAAEMTMAQNAQGALGVSAVTNRPAVTANADSIRRTSIKERIEQLKRNNPEQYAEMLKRRDEYRQNMERIEKERIAFFENANRASMSDAQRLNHDKLLESLKAIGALRGKLLADQGENEEATLALRRQLAAKASELRDLYAAERRCLLEETVRAIGGGSTNVSAYADRLQKIFDSTSMSGASERSAETQRR